MDRTIAWLRDRPYYDGQIRAHRTVPGRDARYGDVDVDPRLESALAAVGIDRPYRHQAEGIESIRDGRNLVVATPTASGKSLMYTVPAFERAMDHTGCTLYIAPQVALINDQEETLADVATHLGFGSRATVAQYTGRLDREEKRTVRDRQPTVLLTTPDMLHYGILPHAHRLWEWFVRRLELVVLDEVHEYRGVFGSHVALVVRRLERLCERFGSDPQYVCCSATIGNPVGHAAAVTGRSESTFDLVDQDTAATGPTHWLFWNPPEYGDEAGWQGSGRRRSSHVETERLFVDLVTRGFQTLVFTRARQAAERYATKSADDLRERERGELADAVTAYQAALGTERRSEIEAGLRDGEIRGVWSTNALELGVDIGGLDAVLLDGYPGTRMAAFQQAGRAGRGADPSLVGLVAGEDQLDQYVMANPDAFFDGEPERAVVNPRNDQLLPGHVLCAARENWLSTDDEAHFGPDVPSIVSDLEDAGELEGRHTREGLRWTYDGGGSPQQDLSLRTIDDREITLLDRTGDTSLGGLPFANGLRDAHPGAIYHHQGRTYEVVDLDLSRDVAALEPTFADYYTRVLHEKSIVVDGDRRETTLPTRDDVVVRLADLTMHKRITGFERRDAKTGETLGREPLDLPETSLRTTGLYFTVPGPVESSLRAAEGSFPGAIHAAEHAMIALFPLRILCDRRDIGGLSTPVHPHTCASTIFIYDGYPGGVGLARDGYEEILDLMDETRRLIAGCSCSDGCPACVQSPHCGNANDPLDKTLALDLLGALVEPNR